MKIIILGLGSIGQRHARNLAILGHTLVVADPYAAAVPGVLWYSDWRRALIDHPDLTGCIIASPTAEHYEQLCACLRRGHPCYVEKPIALTSQCDMLSVLLEVIRDLPLTVPSVTGYQYAFHPAMPAIENLARRHTVIDFSGCDRLLARYGPDVDGVMVAHPIRTALALLGPAVDVNLMSNGVQLAGHIVHQGGKVSRYNFNMDRGPRESWVRANGAKVALTASDTMYSDCLAAWTIWLAGGRRDPRLSSLSDGLEVTRVLAKVSHWERA